MSAERLPLDLRDPRQAGAYRVMRADLPALRALAEESGIAVHEIDLCAVDDKADLMDRIHEALAFPAEWGRNWDALEDGLRDLSWLGADAPRILVWRGMERLHSHCPALEATLTEMLEDASDHWAGHGFALWSLLCLEALPPDCLGDRATAPD